MSKPLPLRREILIFSAIALISVLLRLAFVHEPFERDEGFFASIAQEILRGGIPYRDAIDIKPPGIFYLYALALATFGQSVEAIRIFAALYSIGTLAVVYYLARKCAGPLAAMGAASVFAIFSCAPFLHSNSNVELFMALPLVLSVALFVNWLENGKSVFLAASGFCCGMALLFKTVALPYVALLFLFLVVMELKKGSVKGALLGSLVFTAPMALLALGTTCFFYLKGGLSEFYACNVSIPFVYASGGRLVGPSFTAVFSEIGPSILLPALVALPTAVIICTRKVEAKLYLMALLLPAACLGVLLPGKNFNHYYFQLYPFLAVLSGIGIAMLCKVRGGVAVACWLAIASSFGFYLYSDYRYFTTLSPWDVSEAKYGKTFLESVVIADYLKKRTKPDDYIFQWGFEPELYFLSDRRFPNPYLSSTTIAFLPDQEQAIKKMIDSLQQKKPAYIVVQGKWAQWPGFMELLGFLSSEYHYATRIGYGIIYQRNTPGS